MTSMTLPVAAWAAVHPPAVLDEEAALRFVGSLQAMQRLSPWGVTVDLTGVVRCTLPGLAALVDAVQVMRADGLPVLVSGVSERVAVLAASLGSGVAGVIPRQGRRWPTSASSS